MRREFLGYAVLVLLCLLIYARSLGYPLIFDDHDAIVNNPTIRGFAAALTPPTQNPLTSRPVTSLTFAFNYALGDFHPAGYRGINILLHIVAAFTLWRLARILLTRPSMSPDILHAASGLSYAIALLWAVHPLVTETVVYVTQRTELLMALCYLGTLYFAARALISPKPFPWRAAAVGACALGMGSKEIMLSAPLAVLLMDRTFFSPSFKTALRSSWTLYSSLAATWAFLAILILSMGDRSHSVGTHMGVSSIDWLFTQSQVILHYLTLSVWPHPLLITYDWPIVHSFSQVVLPMFLIGSTCLAAFFLVFRGTKYAWLGFLGTLFFLILGPTSSFMPITSEVIAERRMYLPLACLIPIIVLAVHHLLATRLRQSQRLPQISGALLAVTAILLTWTSIHRLADYETEERIWASVVEYQPHNSNALNGLGMALYRQERHQEAFDLFVASIKADERNFRPYINIGNILIRAGRFTDALPYLQAGIRLNPQDAPAHNSLANCLFKLGNLDAAAQSYTRALQLDPDLVSANVNFATFLNATGHFADAAKLLTRAITLEPSNASAHAQMGVSLASTGNSQGALDHMNQAVTLDPDSAESQLNLGLFLSQLGKPAEAITHLQAAVQLAQAGQNQQVAQRATKALANLNPNP